MHEIKLYGEVVPFEDNWIMEMGGYINLTYLQQQLKEAGGKDVRIRINSCGGDVDTGFAMYAELRRYAKDNNAKVETFGESRVASIATVFFLAGDSRILTEHTEPFVHNAWTYVEGDSRTISRVATELDKYNGKIAQHYANHTDLTFEEALELMNAETSITTEEAKNMRFATEIEEVLRPVALQRFNNKNLDMNKNKKTPTILAKAEAFLKSVGLLAVNKIVMTADEVELDFYELEENEVIEVGANVRVDGDDSVTADYVMKSGETYKIVDGVLAEIVEASSEENESADAVALQAEIDNLTSQLEAVTNAAKTLEATNKSQSAIIANLKKVGSQEAPENGGKAREKEIKTEKGAVAKEAIANFITKKPLISK